MKPYIGLVVLYRLQPADVAYFPDGAVVPAVVTKVHSETRVNLVLLTSPIPMAGHVWPALHYDTVAYGQDSGQWTYVDKGGA